MKQKTFVCVVLVLCGLILVAFAGGVRLGREQGADEVMSHVYPLCGVVREVDYTEDTITIEDFVGHQWVWEGAEDWMEGDIAACIMDDNGTTLVYDDIILDIHYEGWVE